MSNSDIQIRILDRALNSSDQPRPLARQLAFFGEDYPATSSLTVAELITHACSPDPNNSFKLKFHRALIHWDYVREDTWTAETKPNTKERRDIIYKLLDLSAQQGLLLDAAMPHFIGEHATVIAESHGKWYTHERENEAFYWPAYRRYLEKKPDWTDESIQSLADSTKQVVERLADPSQTAAFQSKGLVVGYVQSGKTANFTGVAARAADAGYRLIIILTGTTEMLRQQTQRRLDKEMIGRELLENDYEGDAEIGNFISHGTRPSSLGHFDWQRLTGPEYDYQSLKRGIDALEFERINRNVPFFNRENLRHSKARLIVIKKNSAVLGKVIGDLRRIQIRGRRLDDVPALIIDDESDQASVNTQRPGQPRKDSGINALIVKLLRILPRAQYVGYTATPFANVFIDPMDAEDLFPKDFILSLPRPPGYMGVSEFYDLDTAPPDDWRSNRKAFVRGVIGDDFEDPKNLQAALDSFILSGALKLFRKNAGVNLRTPHHTMLIHCSAFRADHTAQVSAVTDLFRKSDYRGGQAYQRLVKLYERDFLPVTQCRAPSLPMPARFQDLSLFIGQCLSRLYENGDPVLKVNSDTDADILNFDRGSVCKILVGGTKLSRGFTVEGLTVSYYRRAARSADTLMQMGRWFGFREGYSDLVRLFLGVQEPLGKRGGTIDLYEAFGALCRDEEMFRAQLKRYASMDDPRILPIQVPPLVPSHMLLPTARNKMYNARIKFQNRGKEWTETTLAPTDPKAIEHNWVEFNRLLEGTELSKVQVSYEADEAPHKFGVIKGKIDKGRILTFLQSYKWLGSNQHPIQRDIEFLQGTGRQDPQIDNWLFLAPQQVRAEDEREINGQVFSVFRRSRMDDNARVGVYSEPPHRLLAEFACLGKRKDDSKMPISNMSKSGEELHMDRQAIFLFYLLKTSKDDKAVFPAFALFYPGNNIQTPVEFGVADPTKPDAVVVPLKKASGQ